MKILFIFLISLAASRRESEYEEEYEMKKEKADLIRCLLRHENLFNDLYNLYQTIQDKGDTLKKVSEVLPRFMKGIKKCEFFELNNITNSTINKPTHEIVNYILGSSVIFDDVADLIEAFEKKDVPDIFETVVEIMSDFLSTVKKCLSNKPKKEEKIDCSKYNSRTVEVVKCFLKKEKLFEDLTKLIDVMASKQTIEIACTVFEVVPMFIRDIRKCTQI